MDINTLLLILLFVFIGLVIMVMFLFLKRIVVKINKQSKNYFIDKLQAYDNLIKEKEEKLKGLNEEINKIKKISEEEINKNNENKVEKSVFLYDNKNIDYQDGDIFQKMKDIDSKFNIDNIALIKKVIDENFDDSNVFIYEKLLQIREQFNEEFVYKLITSREKVQEEKIKELLGDYSVLLDDFKNKNKKFNVTKFLSYFDKIISDEDPYIYIYVGNKNYDYSDLNPYIRMKYDEKIYKGISIVYRKKLYDYSLK